MSIRLRLTLWYAAVLACALALFGGLVWVSMQHRLYNELDRDLNESAERFNAYLKAELALGAPEGEIRDELNEFCQGLPSASYVYVHSGSGFVFRFPAGAPPPGQDSRSTRRELVWAGERFEIEVAAPVAEVRHTLDLLVILLWSLLPVVIAIACAGGWWLSGRVLKPVQAITAAAYTISVENLSRRLPVPETGDELARLTQVLNSMLERIESSMRTLSQFAADASHELRTPLSVIRTTSELALRRDRPADAYRESLQEVAAEATRMTALIEDLLTLARGDTGVAEMPLEATDLCGVLRDVISEMRGLAEIREARLQASLPEEAIIAGNRAALHRLFVVLIDNAIKYSREGGDVVVAVRCETSIAVTIQDFGAGIAEQDLPRIFERFYRADRSRSSPGHGLGLALAESIARLHGATIEVESTEGAGSIFRVTFAPRRLDRSGNLQFGRVSSST